MRLLKRFFYILTALIIIPTFIFIGVIIWLYATGNKLRLPLPEKSTVNDFLLDAPIRTEPVYSGENPENNQEPAGIRGYIEISKSDLAAMTPSQYLSFYEQKLKDSDYLWFSFVCPDGSGLFIPDCADGSACFCSLRRNGRQESIYGYLIIKDGECIYQETK